jgi:peptidoglycan/LPS O-acetylase OafA/YrhL
MLSFNHKPDATHIISYRPDIDGLRALAITLVVLVHAFPTVMPNGFIGVDIFFVISGFLISSILLTQLQSASFSLLDFYIRRVNRIFPALILVLVVCLSFGWIALYASEFKELGASVAAGAGFVANVNVYFEVGYWDISSKVKPLLHLWSLGIEEQFYLLWPLLLWATWTLRFNVVTICIVIICMSLSWNLISIGTDQAATFYLPFSRFWELLTGCTLACVSARLKMESVDDSQNSFFRRMIITHRESLNNVCALLGAALIIAALVERYPLEEFPGKHAIPPVLGAALIIFAGPNAWINARLLAQRGVVYVGLISFPLYLWHWPLLTFARILEGGELSNQSRNSAVFLAIILAIATYHFLEKPLRSSRQGRGLKAIILTALLATCGGFGYFIQANDGLAVRYVLPQPPDRLTYTPPKSTRTSKVVLLGDSNASHLMPGLLPIFENSLIEIAIPGWPFFVGTAYRKGYVPPGKEHVGTLQMTEKAFSLIVSDPAIDVVIISNQHDYYFTIDILRSYPNVSSKETSAMAYEAGLQRTIKALIDAGKQVIVVKSIPLIRVSSTSVCAASNLVIQRRRLEACRPQRKDVQKSRENYDLALNRALKDFPDVAIFDTMAYLCDEQYCYAEKRGVLLYNDSMHLSNAGSELVAVELAKRVETMRTSHDNR